MGNVYTMTFRMENFYIKDPRGEYTSIHGDKVRQIKCKRLKDLHKERRINSGKKFYESDSNLK